MKSMSRGLISAFVATGLVLTAMAPAYAASSKPAAAAAPAAAPSAPTSIGTFKSWTAWTGKDANGLICYVSAEPTSSKPAGLNRDPVHFLVVHRKGLGTKNEVQTLIGYPLKKDGKPTAAIDGKSYPMIADGNGAWLASAADEAGFVTALKSGTTLVVKGTSQRGTETTDTYSLSGATAAMQAIDKACS
ncbi:MAG: invasion associated locus B family protein [Devosia sp.]|nr:invasion associated locus B family protein [Devosia sp.]